MKLQRAGLAAEQDPLWYDREEAEEPKGLLSLMACLVILSVTKLVLLPALMLRAFKQGIATLMTMVEQARR